MGGCRSTRLPYLCRLFIKKYRARPAKGLGEPRRAAPSSNRVSGNCTRSYITIGKICFVGVEAPDGGPSVWLGFIYYYCSRETECL
ncbi:hypothetical protein CSUI_005813 [Cystoisospora suis]|uniref:Uncharacterized protein n=1 Tax=Cystoisospora suis TaxID=483139 RepID=A0A2C6KWN7_9APIC|nr:hypothetical protein CSUI_005813 [Cystoisospora suis]